MKILSLAILYAILSVFYQPVTAKAQSVPYALINENCIMYLDSQLLSPLFRLPPTYFVKILNEEEDTYKVSYLDCVGYVQASSVTIVDYTPANKFPTSLSTKVFNDGNTVTLRSSPSHLKDNTVKRISSGATVTFYGVREGTEQIKTLGNEWYYIKDTEGNFGYVYNLYADKVVFPQNDYTASEKSTAVSATASLSLSPQNGTVLIIALCIPATVLLILALKTVRKRSE